MNILIINHYAGSPEMGMEFRPYYFAREWIKMGHRVDIIAGDYSHLRRINPEVRHSLQEEIIDGIHYHWVKTGSYDGNGVKRAMSMARFISKTWLRASHIVSEIRPDVVITSSTYPLDTYVGQRIRKVSRWRGRPIKLIHEVHDMWPISPIEVGGMSPKHPFIRVMQMGENSFCRNSDLVVSLLPAADEYLGEHGMKKDKFHHVANGVVLEEWEHPRPLPDEHQQVFRKAHDEGKFILCFFGSHTKSYGLDILIDAVKGLDDDRVLVTFVGDGFYKQELIDRCRGAEDKFIFLPPIPKQSIPSLFNEIDAVYVAAGLSNLMRFGVCMNKLFDSMMGGKPILYAIKAPNNYVTEFNCGVSVEPESVPAVAEGIKQLLAMGEDKRNQLGSNGKEAALKYFNYTALSKRFIEIIEKED